MGKKLTYEFVKEYFKNKQCGLLDTEYINSKTKMKYTCKNGHICYITYNNFNKGYGCMKCGGKEKLTYEYINKYFNDNNCKLLETEYKNNNTKMQYICKNGHKTLTTFSSFMANHQCSKCSGNEKYTFEYVSQYFKDNGCKLLTTEYLNTNAKMEYICKNNHITSVSFTKFISGRSCSECNGNRKFTFEYIYQYFKNNNCKLLSTEYLNTNTKMKYICKNNHKTDTTFSNFSNGKRCKKCKNKTESIILKYLEDNYQNVIFQAQFDWCKNDKSNNLPFDLLLTDFKIIIECDGLQHFKQVSNWTSPLLNLKNDIYKANLAINNGYKIIRIFQEDVFNNKFNWQTLLKENIEKLNNTDDIKIIYLSTDANLYNKHKFELTKKIIEEKLSNFKI